MNNSKTVELNIFGAYSPKRKQQQVKSIQLALLIQYQHMPICNTDKVNKKEARAITIC